MGFCLSEKLLFNLFFFIKCWNLNISTDKNSEKSQLKNTGAHTGDVISLFSLKKKSIFIL